MTTSLVDAARARGVRGPVLDAMTAVPRPAFVPDEHRAEADLDRPVPISHRQVTTQPSLSAQMIEALDLRGGERVLEIGTGYGYQTALLARLAGWVVSVEVHADLADTARANLDAYGVDNVEVVVGDGSQGRPEAAPFHGILVSAAFPEVPPPLVDQLVEGGRLVQPMGSGGQDQVVLFRKRGEELEQLRLITPARFVPLTGEHGFPER